MAGDAKKKLDLHKLHEADYVTPEKPTLIDVQTGRYLAIDGRGGPKGDHFDSRLGALYGMARALESASRDAGRDFVVVALEGQWWADGSDDLHDFQHVPDEQVRWKLLIRMPDFVADDDLAEARRTLRARENAGPLDDVRLETLDEGTCVQMLHVGPYETEQTTMDAMTAFAEAEGLTPRGRHHEVYLDDPRRVPPEKLRTIVRQPVAPRA